MMHQQQSVHRAANKHRASIKDGGGLFFYINWRRRPISYFPFQRRNFVTISLSCSISSHYVTHTTTGLLAAMEQRGKANNRNDKIERPTQYASVAADCLTDRLYWERVALSNIPWYFYLAFFPFVAHY
jgi:hypothetical protein